MNFPLFFLLLLPHQAFQYNHGKGRIWSNCEEFFLTNNMIAGAERITIGLGRSNLSVVCTVDNTTSEVIMLLQHSTMDFIKVDGFQEPGSFHQVVDYELSLAEMVGLLGVSSRCWQILEFRQYFSTLVKFLKMMRNLLAECGTMTQEQVSPGRTLLLLLVAGRARLRVARLELSWPVFL